LLREIKPVDLVAGQELPDFPWLLYWGWQQENRLLIQESYPKCLRRGQNFHRWWIPYLRGRGNLWSKFYIILLFFKAVSKPLWKTIANLVRKWIWASQLPSTTFHSPREGRGWFRWIRSQERESIWLPPPLWIRVLHRIY
jgi:hypothetical protein